MFPKSVVEEAVNALRNTELPPGIGDTEWPAPQTRPGYLTHTMKMVVQHAELLYEVSLKDHARP
jgi:hypothetical protein